MVQVCKARKSVPVACADTAVKCYSDNSHAAEVTSGYYNTNQNDAYLVIARMFAENGVHMDFTALELKDNTQYGGCGSSNNINCGSLPEELVDQTLLVRNRVS